MFHLSEFMFLGGFIVFIAAILVLDMLVIDKKAHEVSIREAGTWTAVWITLALAFSAFLWFKGDMVHGISSFADLKAVASAYAPHLKLDPSDFEASLQQYRHYMTVSYISGYLIEIHGVRRGQERVSARAQLGHPRRNSAALRVHLPRRSHNQPLRLGAAGIRWRTYI